jgi:hypothetical protein
MSDALTSFQTRRTKDVDLAANDRPSKLTKQFFPSYFSVFSLLPQHSSSRAKAVGSKPRVEFDGQFLSAEGFVAVV